METETAKREGDLITKKENQDFYFDLLKTVPVDVPYAEMCFMAKGIPDFSLRHFNEEKYIENCKSQGVIPFSKLSLRYDSDLKNFLFDDGFRSSIIRVYKDSSEERRNAAFEGLLNGGQVHLLEFKTSLGYFPNYEKIKDEILDNLKEAEYQISESDLWLSTYRLTGYNEGTYRQSGLRIKSLGLDHYTSHLQLDRDTGEKGREKMWDWFTGLAAKHNLGFENIR